MALGLAVIITLFTFGVPVAIGTSWVFARGWQLSVKCAVALLTALVLWVPAGLLGALMSEAFEVDWGHAGAGFVFGYLAGSILDTWSRGR